MAAALLWVTTPGFARTSAGASATVLIAPSSVDPALDQVAEGFEAWLAIRMEGAGIATVPRADVRSHTPRARADALSPDQMLALASQLGADFVVFTDLRVMSGQVEVRLRLAQSTTKQLISGSRATASFGDVGAACEATAAEMIHALGASEQAGLPPRLDELAASGRALLRRDRGDLYGAWKEVAHKLSPTAVATRKDIVRAAMGPSAAENVSASARARVLAAAGHADRAWPLIERAVKREVVQPQPDAELLLAAAEVELARSNPRDARGYVDRLLESGARGADVHATHARILLEANDTVRARRALITAMKLDPSNPEIIEQLAELEAADRRRQAELLIRAGRREARLLNTHRAERLFDRAARTDSALAAETWRSRGELRRDLGKPAESLTAYRNAVDAGGGDASSFSGMGDAERALGQTARAVKSYEQALVLEPNHPGALDGLGTVHLLDHQPAKAVPLLQRSVKAAPENLVRRRNLAQALRATGDLEGALRVLKLAPQTDPRNSAQNLRLLAEIHAQIGNHEAARDALLQATRFDPFDPDIQEQLADAYESTGDAGSAARAREMTALLRGEAPTALARAADRAGAAKAMRMGPSLDGIVASFAEAARKAHGRPVVFLGIRSPVTWRERLYTWLHPRKPDTEAISHSLQSALARSFELVDTPPLTNPLLQESVDRLYEFEKQESLNATNIAAINQSLESQAIFVARLERAPDDRTDAATGSDCADPDRFEIEVRMLSGRRSDAVSVLANRQCIPAGFRDHGLWNEHAAASYGALLLLLLFPLLRGWGRVNVIIELPPNTKGFFSIRVAKHADEGVAERSRSRSDGRLKRSLRSLSRYERHMVGRETLFRWIPARARSYHVTVKGPLMDTSGKEIIGHFLETKKLAVKRGRTSELEFDFQPKECGVEVRIQRGGQPVEMARIALRGDPNSIRYARGGIAVLPLDMGTHQLLIGANDRVSEFQLQIDSLGRSLQIAVNLDDENALAFKECPAAVEPYLMGDFRAAADALEAAGIEHQAHIVRASYHKQSGANEAAADELEAAGFLEEAAEMRATGDDIEGSARLFEQAGDYDRAGEAHQAAGNFADAARCYEAAYNWYSALECYREAGDDPKALEILEKTGEYFEAGSLAGELQDANRALVNLKQVETRDPNYGNACKLIADILEERGDIDIAADKIKEAIDAAGNNAAAELYERHADLLAKSGETQMAIGVYRTVRRIDPQRRDLGERIEALERGNGGQPAAAGEAAQSKSRYEILGELGRGAMGVVLKARDKNLGRIVALKRLPDSLNDHPTAVALFKREAQAAAALNHRNIVTVFDAGEENGLYFITMELLEGMPLNQILKQRGRLKVSDTARLGIQIAAGLQYAKENRIVHRDIKTGNLFFTKDRTVKIMDFGLAKTIEEVRKTSTMIGGTPYFMAPEQAIGDELDHRADLYAFGVTLYQLVTGTVPFKEGDLAYHHRHTPPPDPRNHVAEIPEAMAELILQMLAKAPDDRPNDPAEVSAKLQAILSEASGVK